MPPHARMTEVRHMIEVLRDHETPDNVTEEDVQLAKNIKALLLELERIVGMRHIATAALIQPAAVAPSSIQTPFPQTYDHPVAGPDVYTLLDLLSIHSLTDKQSRATAADFPDTEKRVQSATSHMRNIVCIQRAMKVPKVQGCEFRTAVLRARLEKQVSRALRHYPALCVDLPQRYQVAMVLQAQWDAEHVGDLFGPDVMGVVNEILIQDLQQAGI